MSTHLRHLSTHLSFYLWSHLPAAQHPSPPFSQTIQDGIALSAHSPHPLLPLLNGFPHTLGASAFNIPPHPH